MKYKIIGGIYNQECPICHIEKDTVAIVKMADGEEKFACISCCQKLGAIENVEEKKEGR